MSKNFVVRDDGIYIEQYQGYGQVTTGQYSQLVLPKDVLREAISEWFGIIPKCQHCQDGHCLNTAQHWRVYCNGFKDRCSNGG